MMVYHHFLTLIRCKNWFHLIKTAGTIEIQTENQICISKGCLTQNPAVLVEID